MKRIWLLAWVVLGLGCIDEAARAPVHDVGVQDQGTADMDARPECVEDRYGLGRADLPAADLGSGLYPDLQICDVPDWFSVAAPVGARLQVRLESDRAVTARVHGAVVLAEGTGRHLKLEVVVPFEGVRLEVMGAEPTAYRLTVAEVATVEGCADADEPDGPDVPTVIEVTPRTRALCAGDVDWWQLDGPPGASVDWQVEVLEGGPLRVQVGALHTVAVEGLHGASRVLGAGGLRLVVSGAEARYRVWGTVHAPPAVVQRRFEGLLESVDRPVTASGLGAAQWRSGAGLVVDVEVGTPPQVAAVTQADGEGRFALVAWLPEDQIAQLRVRAQAGTPATITVGPEVVARQPWALTLVEADQRWRPSDAPAMGALNVAMTLAEGLERQAAVVPVPDPPPLHVVWRPQGVRPCGSCFHPGDAPWIDLSGATLDPDEWDDAVILHELGHFVASVYSRDDSPGGRHDGTAVEPRLAWSEGWASFFAGWVRGTPSLLDVRLNRVSRLDLEAPGASAVFGGEALEGLISDHLVAAVLWDLWDAEADGEHASLDAAALFGALYGLVTAEDQGAPGMDLADYLSGLVCDELPGTGAAEAAQGAWAATGYPLDVRCQKPGAGPLTPAEGDGGCLAAGAWTMGSRRGSADARCSAGRPRQ
jgi:hypothetical protein